MATPNPATSNTVTRGPTKRLIRSLATTTSRTPKQEPASFPVLATFARDCIGPREKRRNQFNGITSLGETVYVARAGGGPWPAGSGFWSAVKDSRSDEGGTESLENSCPLVLSR